MVNLRRFLKPYKDAGALHSLLPVRRFIDDQVFLTKRNQLGVVLQVKGLDSECPTEAMLESTTRRMAGAWRSVDDRFRIYQYVVKQDHPGFEQPKDSHNATAAETTTNRLAYLESKQPGLFSIQLYSVILLEPGLPVRNAATDLQRNRATLIGHVESLQRTIGDLLGVDVLSKREAFSFFRLLINLIPRSPAPSSSNTTAMSTSSCRVRLWNASAAAFESETPRRKSSRCEKHPRPHSRTCCVS